MNKFLAGTVATALAALMPTGSLAEPNDRPPKRAPILSIVTYDTGHGTTASASYFFGQPITGPIRFRTIGERDTRKEGFDRRGKRH